MGCRLGFRRPQFSEDLAWLPDWLQQHQSEPFDAYIKEPQSRSELEFKDLVSSPVNITGSEDGYLFSREEGRYNNCCLFLPGEDNSPIILSSSPENVFHFHLRLSLDGNSQYSCSQQLDTSRKLLQHNNVLATQLVENSVESGGKTLSKMHSTAAGPNSLPLDCIQENVENVCLPSPSNKKDSERKYEDKFNCRFLNDADVCEAVELSIAASEALAIHELVKCGLASEELPAKSVLEVALQVKQARLEISEDAFYWQTEETDMCDSLSDLDDVVMADAFEDMGLSCSVPNDLRACDSGKSRIKETPLSENHYTGHDGLNFIDVRSQEVSFDDISTWKHLEEHVDMDLWLKKGLPLESLDIEMKGKLPCDPVLVSSTSKVAAHVDSMLHQLGQQNSDGLSMKQEVDTFSLSKQKHPITVPRFFLGETSFLSESADIAPDENSFVQTRGSKLGTQSSIPIEGPLEKAHEGILLSQDMVRPSSLSFVDPLCSAVPCSISMENGNSTQVQSQNDGENSSEKCLRPLSELRMENLQRSPYHNVESEQGDRQAAYKISGEGSGGSARRLLTSLKSYSMLFPNHISLLEGGSLCYNKSFQLDSKLGLLSSDLYMCCTQSSDSNKRGSTDFLNVVSDPNCFASENNEDTHETTIEEISVAQMTTQKRNYDEIAGEEDVCWVQPLEKRTSPPVINQKQDCHLLGFKQFVNSFTREKHPRKISVPGSNIKHHQSKSLQNIQSKYYNSHDKHVSVRKRVHFSEAGDLLMQTKNLEKQQSSHKNCTTVRARKGLKSPTKWSRAHGMKSYLPNYCIKVGKRLIFQGIEFLLTGFSSEKTKEIEELIWEYGGMVLLDIPSPPNSRGKRGSRSICPHFPIILCLQKLETTKFLYGCAVNALILKVAWLTDSIASGSIMPPEEYMVLSNLHDAISTRSGKLVRLHNNTYIFERVGILLHGKHSFCMKFSKVFKHGGGQVFKTLQWLVKSLDGKKISIGAIVAEDKSRISRHLKHCASEQEILLMPASWIVKSLHSGRLLPITEKNHFSTLPTYNNPEAPTSREWSEEI